MNNIQTAYPNRIEPVERYRQFEMEGRIDKRLGVPTELLPARVNCPRSGSELDMQLSPHDDVPFATTLGPIEDKNGMAEALSLGT